MKITKKRLFSILALLILCLAINRYAHLQQHRLANKDPEKSQIDIQEKEIPAGATVFEAREPQHRGWDGDTPLEITVSEDGKIASVKFLPNNETPEWIRLIENRGFMNSWNGLTPCEAVGHHVDALSGATITTVAVIATLRDNLHKRIESGEIECLEPVVVAEKSKTFDFKLLASLAVLALALFSFFFPKKAYPIRLYLLALSVIILGFWQGQYLSVTYFFNVLSRGFNWAVWIIPIMTILAFLLPLITKKNFYCMYVCPYGAAQELIAKLNKKHVKISQELYKKLIRLRPAFLLVIIVLLFAGILSDFANFEPFGGFMLNVNLWIPMIIAGVFLLISLLIPKFWCKYCCPTGYMIDMTRNF